MTDSTDRARVRVGGHLATGPPRRRRLRLGSGDAGDGTDDTIVIGISLPLTGDFSEPGKGVAARLRGLGRPTSTRTAACSASRSSSKILDDQSNADRVASDYEKLISQDEVDLVFGPFSTRLVVPAAQVAKEYGFLFVEPAGAAAEVFEQGFDNLFYAAPAVANDHYNLLAEQILAMPEAERPEDRRVRRHGRPVRAGHGVRPEGQARSGGHRDRRRRGLPAQHHRLQQHRREDRRLRGRHGRRRHAVPGRGQPHRRPAAARLPAEDGRVLDRADQRGVPRRDRREDRGHPLAHRLHDRRDYPSNEEFVEKYTELNGTPPGRGRGQRLDDRPGRRRGRRGGRLRRAAASASRS